MSKCASSTVPVPTCPPWCSEHFEYHDAIVLGDVARSHRGWPRRVGVTDPEGDLIQQVQFSVSRDIYACVPAGVAIGLRLVEAGGVVDLLDTPLDAASARLLAAALVECAELAEADSTVGVSLPGLKR